MTEAVEDAPSGDVGEEARAAPGTPPAMPPGLAAPAPATLPARRKRPLRVKLAALGLSLAFTLLAIELAARVATHDPVDDLYAHYGRLRTAYPTKPLGKNAFFESSYYPSRLDPPAHIFELDPKVGFKLLSSNHEWQEFHEAPSGRYLLHTNALGLRDERPLVPKKNGVLRVLAVGDSMTYGLGVEREEAWPAVLEKRLAASLGREVEVVNVGCPCWGQREEVAWLEHRARALEPDAVILEFTVANDVLDDLRYVEDRNGDLVPDVGPRGFGTDLEQHPIFQNPLAEHSRAYRLLVWHLGRHVVRYRAMLEPWRLERASDLILRARGAADALGASFLLVVAPTSVQVDEALTGRLLSTEKINEAILARAARDGIDAVDPRAALKKAKASGKRLYFPVDQHWNVLGNSVVADAVLEKLPGKLGK